MRENESTCACDNAAGSAGDVTSAPLGDAGDVPADGTGTFGTVAKGGFFQVPKALKSQLGTCLLYFGYVHCATRCPPVIAALKLVNVPVLFVSIDPKDTAEDLAAFVTATGFQVIPANDVLMADFRLHDMNYGQLDTHTADVYYVKDGKWIGLAKAPITAERLIADAVRL